MCVCVVVLHLAHSVSFVASVRSRKLVNLPRSAALNSCGCSRVCLSMCHPPPLPRPTPSSADSSLLPRPSYTFCNAFLLLLQILQANRQKQTTSMLRNLKLHSAALVAVAVVAARVVAVVALVVAVRIAFCINCQRKSACHSTGFPFPVASAPFLVSLSISHSLSLVLSLSWFRCLLLG